MDHVLAELGLTPRKVTGLVDALDSSGLLTRRSHGRDQRALRPPE